MVMIGPSLRSDRLFKTLPEFAYVTFPGLLLERRHRFFRKVQLFSMGLLGRFSEESCCKGRNILGSVS